MRQSQNKSTIEMISQIRKLTGEVIRLRIFEEVSLIQEKSPDLVYVMVKSVKTTEQRSGYKVIATGTRLHIFTRKNATWTCEVIESWDTVPSHDFVRTRGQSKSPQEYWDQATHEDMCHRPGTARNPMDNVAVRSQL